MRFRFYRSLDEIAEIWAEDSRAPGDQHRLHRVLVEGICDGAFFEAGLAIRAHALLRSLDPEGEGYAPFPRQAERLPDGTIKSVAGRRVPDFEDVHDRVGLHAYLGAPASVPDPAVGDPDVFFDWVKHTDPASRAEAVDRLLAHVVINMRAFRNWCRTAGRAVPGFVADWHDSLPLDPNHRGLSTLPDADLISLCEAVTWLTTGRARPAPVLRRLMDRHHGSRRPQGLWRELEEDAEKLISALRRCDLTAYGQLDGGPHLAMPPEYFVNDVFAEFALDLIAPDPMAWSRGTYPDGLPTYQAVRFRRSELWSVMRNVVREPERGDRAGRNPTAAAGRRCFHWLRDLMREGPQTAPKRAYEDQAIEEFAVSKRQFDVAWMQARQEVGNSAWGRRGRRSMVE